jgi:hypothetical protein
MRQLVRYITILTCSLAFCLASVFAQSNSPDASTAAESTATKPQSASRPGADGKAGFAVKASLLGGGAEFAAAVTHRTNVRAGFNIFMYDRTFHKDSVNYAGKLSFKTVEAHYDIFPWAKSFHISPGVLVFVGAPVTATAAVPARQSFTLGGNTYFSDATVPVAGKGKINFNRAAPMITVGWGNLIRHGEGRHFTVPFEVGIAYQGSPKATLNLTGNVCDTPGVNCRSIASDSTVQSHVQDEQNKINHSMEPYKVYPIISIGFGYKF